jgi:hypothetical protein
MIRKTNNKVCGLPSRSRDVDAQRPSCKSDSAILEPNAKEWIAKISADLGYAILAPEAGHA